jgi:hypothetical protein
MYRSHNFTACDAALNEPLKRVLMPLDSPLSRSGPQ